MSFRYYEVFTLQPDMTNPPVFGAADDRDVNSPSDGPNFIAWTDRTDRLLFFKFQTFSSSEWRIIREFFDRHGGRAKAFYLPSWNADFELVADAEIGATSITVNGHFHTNEVPDNRPDTIGRRLMIIDQTGATSTHWIKNFITSGPNDILFLDSPLAAALEAGRCIISICYLARMIDDTIESVHLSINHTAAELKFREVTHRRRLDQTESATGSAISSMKAAFDLVATDQDPLYDNLRSCVAIGPISRNAPQAANFGTEWLATLDPLTNLVTTDGPGDPQVCALYNAPGPADQIALTHDAVSKEVLAWSLDGEVWIAWTAGDGVHRIHFEGYSPVAFNTFSIDSTVTAGEATVAIFYLKKGDSSIFCRIGAQSYATERRYCVSPIAPMFLHAARRFLGRLELVGMDVSHRRARWRSQAYLTPLQVQVMTGTVGPVTGEYEAVTIHTPVEDSTGGEGIEFTGLYRSVRVVESTSEAGVSGDIVGELSGEYSEVRVLLDTTGDSTTGLVLPPSGSYTLSRKLSIPAPQSITATIHAVTGSYS
jgi:hypothetical protein